MMVETSFWQDYSEVFGAKKDYSWINFSILIIDFERAYYAERFEVHLGILGLNASIDFLWGKMEADRKRPQITEDTNDV